MKRIAFFSILLLTLAVSALVGSSTRVKAITYGFVDSNNTYSNVGAFIVKSSTTGQIFPRNVYVRVIGVKRAFRLQGII